MRRDPSLNFEEIPEWRLPFRFFLLASFMGVLTGVGLVLSASAFGLEWHSRWQLSLIGLLHLFTLGCISTVMIGALFQVTPVMTGHLIKRSHRFVQFFQVLFIAGVLCLVAGLWFYTPLPLLLAAAFIFLSLFLFALRGSGTLFRTHEKKPSANALMLSFVSLFVILGLGVTLLLMHGQWFGLSLDRRLTNIHLVWALAGWVGILIIGVSFQVIPMFHVTPEFSVPLQRLLPKVIFAGLIVYSLGALSASLQWLTLFAKWWILLMFLLYLVQAYRLLAQRKRKLEDVSVALWKSTLAHYLVAVIILLFLDVNGSVGGVLFDGVWQEKLKLSAGVLLLLGVIWSVILAMLQKIVPFLAYLHMQRACGSDYRKIKALPHMRDLAPIAQGRWLKRLHWSATWSLTLTPCVPAIFIVAALLWLVSFLLLLGMIFHVLRMLRKHA